jgi:nitroreductase
MDARTLIDRRYSCRTYLEQPISPEDQEALEECMARSTRGPLGTPARFGLVAASSDDEGALKRLGTYGFIKGARGFIVGAVRKGPGDLEDYGYLLEEVILEATRIGLGTCWLGGTFTRSTFTSRFGGVGRDEVIPAVVSTGYPGDDGAERIRQREEGTRRFPPGELFFAGEPGVPLGAETDGYDEALEAVRMAPSATNKQPWRIVRRGDDWHFYLFRTKGYGKGSPWFKLLRIADLQRVDMGIAMCHFELVARQSGLDGGWSVADPGLALPGPGIEYTATWRGGAPGVSRGQTPRD